jgi:hypothetical protein
MQGVPAVRREGKRLRENFRVHAKDSYFLGFVDFLL